MKADSLEARIGARIFWSAYDPLDLASNSIDPLGFARGYLALADLFLPGLTTVTRTPRYVSMLCAAIRVAEDSFPHAGFPVPAKVRQERLDAVKSFERAWALACGLAAQAVGERRVPGLLGVRSIQRVLDSLSQREKYIQTRSFNLLSNQVQYGGLGAYSTLIEEFHLAAMPFLSLRPIGRKLAATFPLPPFKLHQPDARIPLVTLEKWGSLVHPETLIDAESNLLAEVLNGGEEQEHSDRVRSASLRWLASRWQQREWDEGQLLAALANGIESANIRSEALPKWNSQILVTLRIIDPYERFYQSALFVFHSILASVTELLEVSLTKISAKNEIKETFSALQKHALALKRQLSECETIDDITTKSLRTVLTESGICSLADAVLDAADASEVTRGILDRHGQVQSGKFDRGMPKPAWIRLSGKADNVQLTAQRHGLAQAPAKWSDVARHSYRIGSAFSFIHFCKIK